MPGSLKTEAVVLRSMRYGEADRILHLYTPQRGRLSAIAKGVRRTKSRFGGRLEPYFRLQMILYEGRSELLTVTSAETLNGHPRLREHAAALDSAARACDAVGRLFDTPEPHPGVFALLCNELALLDTSASGDQPHSTHANQLAFRLKLLLAAGLAPQLAACASCGEADHLVGFSGAAGGVVCGACEASGFALGQEAHTFMTGALACTLAKTPQAGELALRQAERAISDTVEYHANVRLRSASPL
ncbi:MAG: repair protein RecO [Solirubrobacteraceae bacterium]|jgi:DNA repair protein RecO (recombination protein O)|nr:repair protein RecO [Solirubrobacteraceae bacterium]